MVGSFGANFGHLHHFFPADIKLFGKPIDVPKLEECHI
ncbi:MAG: hypothetical protein ACJAQ7_002788 [Sediminicola sp.]|jgi:hypothetical protein